MFFGSVGADDAVGEDDGNFGDVESGGDAGVN